MEDLSHFSWNLDHGEGQLYPLLLSPFPLRISSGTSRMLWWLPSRGLLSEGKIIDWTFVLTYFSRGSDTKDWGGGVRFRSAIPCSFDALTDVTVAPLSAELWAPREKELWLRLNFTLSGVRFRSAITSLDTPSLGMWKFRNPSVRADTPTGVRNGAGASPLTFLGVTGSFEVSGGTVSDLRGSLRFPLPSLDFFFFLVLSGDISGPRDQETESDLEPEMGSCSA
jgi:hypothetical protein